MQKVITCTVCPKGCQITADEKGGVCEVTGNGCTRGKSYALSEFVCPVRTLTSSVRVAGGTAPLAPIRTSGPIPAERMIECVGLLRKVCLDAPVTAHQVIFENLWDSGVDIVTTAGVPEKA